MLVPKDCIIRLVFLKAGWEEGEQGFRPENITLACYNSWGKICDLSFYLTEQTLSVR